MKGVSEFVKIFLFAPFVDMRKQSLGLSTMIQSTMKRNPFDESLYVFCNRRRDLIKCLYWDKTGFAMWVKKLNQDKFPWPKAPIEDVVFLSRQQMEWLLAGINVWKLKPHKKLDFDRVF